MKTPDDENVSGQLLFWLALSSTVAILFSIAAAQILLGAGLGVLLTRRDLWRAPPVLVPLGLFVAWTAIAKIYGQGWLTPSSQLRKFFVYLVLFLVFCAVRSAVRARWLLTSIALAAFLPALWSFAQFTGKVMEARRLGVPFYQFYLGDRTTGFMSHWMTFSAEMLVALTIAAAFLLFAPARPRERGLGIVILAATALALALNQTRGVWIAAVMSIVYLVAVWKPKWLISLPLIGAGLFIVSPGAIQQRLISIVQPSAEDSNQHRYVTWRTGIAMIEANPVFGVGPDRVETLFLEYVPGDIRRPLPEGWYGHLHNVYLQIAAERGIPGLLLLLSLIGKFVWDWVSALRQLPSVRSDQKFVLHTAMAVLIGMMFGGIFEYNLGNSEPLHLFLAVSGAGYAAVYCSRASSRSDCSQPASV